MQLFRTVVEMSLVSSGVLLLILVVRGVLLQRVPRWIVAALWLVVLVRLLCPVAVTASFSLLPKQMSMENGLAPYVEALIAQSEVSRPQMEPEMVSTEVLSEIEASERQSAGMALAQEPASDLTVLDCWWLGAWLWLLGVAGLLLHSGYGWLRLRRRTAIAIQVEPGVYESDQLPGALVFGFLRPQIYLPLALPDEERSYILCHEQAHLKRHDHLVKLVAYGAVVMHWFNPLVWVMFHLLSRDLEIACDEHVLKTLGREIRQDYSRALLQQSQRQQFPSMTMPLPLAFGESHTKVRVQHLLQYRPSRLWVTVLASVLCVLLALGCLVDPVTPDFTLPSIFSYPISASKLLRDEILPMDRLEASFTFGKYYPRLDIDPPTEMVFFLLYQPEDLERYLQDNFLYRYSALLLLVDEYTQEVTFEGRQKKELGLEGSFDSEQRFFTHTINRQQVERTLGFDFTAYQPTSIKDLKRAVQDLALPIDNIDTFVAQLAQAALELQDDQRRREVFQRLMPDLGPTSITSLTNFPAEQNHGTGTYTAAYTLTMERAGYGSALVQKQLQYTALAMARSPKLAGLSFVQHENASKGSRVLVHCFPRALVKTYCGSDLETKGRTEKEMEDEWRQLLQQCAQPVETRLGGKLFLMQDEKELANHLCNAAETTKVWELITVLAAAGEPPIEYRPEGTGQVTIPRDYLRLELTSKVDGQYACTYFLFAAQDTHFIKTPNDEIIEIDVAVFEQFVSLLDL